MRVSDEDWQKIVEWILANIDPIVGGFIGSCAFVFVFWGLKQGVRLSARSLIRVIYIRRRDTANWVWRMWKSPAWRDEVLRRETSLFRQIILYGFVWIFFVKPLNNIELDAVSFAALLRAGVYGLCGGLVGARIGDYIKFAAIHRSYRRLLIRHKEKNANAFNE